MNEIRNLLIIEFQKLRDKVLFPGFRSATVVKISFLVFPEVIEMEHCVERVKI